MFNSHLFKFIGGFCVMILIGLISLVIIDSYKDKAPAPKASSGTAVVLPDVTHKTSVEAKSAPKTPAAKKVQN